MTKSHKSDTFVDHYALLDCCPDTSADDLKRAYRQKLREFHPDKRRTSTGFGVQKTQSLNEAWEILRDPSRRDAYDIRWQRERNASKVDAERPKRGRQIDVEDPALHAAELRRLEGNRHYKDAQAIVQANGDRSAFRAAMAKYQLAIQEYSEGIQLAPRNHRLWSNRALCHAALKDWSQCREDALRVTQLEPNFMKGWFLLAKAIWKLGSCAAALVELRNALRLLPENLELLALQEEIHAHRESISEQERVHLPHIPTCRGSSSRNVSPCVTPPASRVSTPPPIRSSRSPGPHLTTPGYTTQSSPNTPPRGYQFRDTSLPRVPSNSRGRDVSPGWNNTPSNSQSGTPPRFRRPCETMADRCQQRDNSPGWSNTPPDSREASPASIGNSRRQGPPVRRKGSRQRSSANVRRNVAAAFSVLGADDIG